MLGCRFSSEAHAKNLSEKATKCSVKTTEVVLDGHMLTQGGLNKKEIQLNLLNIFSILTFNELYLFV